MPTNVVLSFGQLTDPLVAFASVDSWNSYFSNVTLTLTSANLPLANLVDPGAVKEALNTGSTVSTWTAQNYGANYYTPISFTDANGSVSTVNALTKEAFDQSVVNINQLKALYDSLIAALQLSGAMSDQ